MLSKIDEIPSEADLLPFGFQDDIGIDLFSISRGNLSLSSSLTYSR